MASLLKCLIMLHKATSSLCAATINICSIFSRLSLRYIIKFYTHMHSTICSMQLVLFGEYFILLKAPHLLLHQIGDNASFFAFQYLWVKQDANLSCSLSKLKAMNIISCIISWQDAHLCFASNSCNSYAEAIINQLLTLDHLYSLL